MSEVSQGLKTVFAAVLVLNKFKYISKCSAQFKNFIIQGWAVPYKHWETALHFHQNYFPTKEDKGTTVLHNLSGIVY